MNLHESLNRISIISCFEMKRIIKSWKMVVITISLSLLILAALGATGNSEDPEWFILPIVASVALFISIFATISASDNISDEFEKGTSLVMLVQPISRWTLFTGKFIGSYVLGIIFVVIFYGIGSSICIMEFGFLPDRILDVFLLSLLYLFSAIGVCNLISSLSPNNGLSMVLCFILLVIVQIFMQNVGFETEPWYSLGYETKIIPNHLLGIQTIFDANMMTEEYQPLLSTAILIMALYGAVTTAVAAVIFRYRDV